MYDKVPITDRMVIQTFSMELNSKKGNWQKLRQVRDV